MRERFEQRLFRIFAQAGYSPVQLLTITPEEMVEIPGSITGAIQHTGQKDSLRASCTDRNIGT